MQVDMVKEYRGIRYELKILTRGIVKYVWDGEDVEVAKLYRTRNDEMKGFYVIEIDMEKARYLADKYNGGRLDTLIPGIDIDECGALYMTSHIPYFIRRKTPDKRRTDINEVMKKFGMTYYDELEFMFRHEGPQLDEWIVDRA
jgi:tRNA splicing endonuclease